MQKFLNAIEALIVWGAVLLVFSVALTSCATANNSGYSTDKYFYTVGKEGAKDPFIFDPKKK